VGASLLAISADQENRYHLIQRNRQQAGSHRVSWRAKSAGWPPQGFVANKNKQAVKRMLHGLFLFKANYSE
jgi:hypothetical protein